MPSPAESDSTTNEKNNGNKSKGNNPIHQSPSYDDVATNRVSPAADTKLKTSSSDSDLLRMLHQATSIKHLKGSISGTNWQCSLCSYNNMDRKRCALCESPRLSVAMVPVAHQDEAKKNEDTVVASGLVKRTKSVSSIASSAVASVIPRTASISSTSSIFDQFRNTTESIRGILYQLAQLEDDPDSNLPIADPEEAPYTPEKVEVVEEAETDDEDELSSRERRREERQQARRVARTNHTAPVSTIYVLQQDEDHTTESEITSDMHKTNYEDLFQKLQQEQRDQENKHIYQSAEEEKTEEADNSEVYPPSREMGQPLSLASKLEAAAAMVFTDESSSSPDSVADDLQPILPEKHIIRVRSNGDIEASVSSPDPLPPADTVQKEMPFQDKSPKQHDDEEQQINGSSYASTKNVPSSNSSLMTATPRLIKQERRKKRRQRQTTQLSLCLCLVVLAVILGVVAAYIVLAED